MTAATPKCWKVRFTQHEAAAAVVDAKIARHRHGNQKRREQRAYPCVNCTAWHLTSSDPR